MPVITLTTDLGLQDHYVAAVKGAAYKHFPDVKLVDISHSVTKFDTGSAAYLVRNAFRHFPEGSVHIIAVNDEPGPSRPFLAVQSEGHHFISTDNGIFSLILENMPTKVVRISSEIAFPKFPLLEVFIKAACHLAKGGSIEDIGQPSENFGQKMELTAYADKDMIKGAVIYIDSYGNAITNIQRAHFSQIGETRPFSIQVGSYDIDSISRQYNEVPEGEIAAVFNTAGNLEIAVNKGNASGLLGLKLRGIIRVEFQ
jgi:S-adenosyl-L-methionine hydrolase (adenosine-forming)